jgi:hypothetical protein
MIRAGQRVLVPLLSLLPAHRSASVVDLNVHREVAAGDAQLVLEVLAHNQVCPASKRQGSSVALWGAAACLQAQ